jgi:hypothetical protein
LADFIAGMAVALLVCGTLAMLYILLVRRGKPRAAGPSTLHIDAMSPRAPKSVNAYWAEGRPGQDRKVEWNGQDGVPWDGEVQYRAPPTATEQGKPHWNPFEPQEQRRERVRAARRRPRPQHHSGRRDFYELLGVEPGANDRQFELAFRTRAAEIHPDRYFSDPVKRREAEERLKELNAAMQVLRDPLRRAKYDATR